MGKAQRAHQEFLNLDGIDMFDRFWCCWSLSAFDGHVAARSFAHPTGVFWRVSLVPMRMTITWRVNPAITCGTKVGWAKHSVPIYGGILAGELVADAYHNHMAS